MKIGFIGAGNMATAMIGGMIQSKIVSSNDFIVSAKTEQTLNKIKDEFHVSTTLDSIEVVKNSKIVFIAVKPYTYELILNQIKDELTKDHILVTIAAGISIEDVENIISDQYKIVRTMPNTPALVGEGMSALVPNKNIDRDELEIIQSLFQSFGQAKVVSEDLIDTVIGVSGSAPAYVYMFIEAMSDCAVSYGMTRKDSYQFAAQTVLGAAKMVLETNEHPGLLKDRVCSPGGTTIEAVKTLETEGFRRAIIKGMSASIEKSKQMGQKHTK